MVDSAHFPDIRFESTKIEAKGQNRWTVRGNLTLHGQSHPIVFDVVLSETLGQTVSRHGKSRLTEDQKRLAETYGMWIEVVSERQRAVIHKGLSSAAVNVAI